MNGSRLTSWIHSDSEVRDISCVSKESKERELTFYVQVP